MGKNKLRWFWCLAAVAFIFLVSLYLYPSIIYSDVLYTSCIYIVVEAIVLVVILSILRKIDMFASWKTGIYLAIVVAASLTIAFLSSPLSCEKLEFYALSVFAFFVFLNIGLSLMIFDISFWKVCLIGVIAGLINAFMTISAISAY